MASIIRSAAISTSHYARLAATHALHLRQKHVGSSYRIAQRGTYTVFRETTNDAEYDMPPTILVVGFRLKLIRSNRSLHWLFQRLCILTTPLWSGMRGFHAKLWLVDTKTKNYLGIYDWRGVRDAGAYVALLKRVLQPFAVPGSVWYRAYTEPLEQFLEVNIV